MSSSQAVSSTSTASPAPDRVPDLIAAVQRRAPREAAELLERESNPALVAQVLQNVNPLLAENVLWQMAEGERAAILEAAPRECSLQWTRNHSYPADSVGRLMDPPIGVFTPDQTVTETIAQLRELVKKAFITYGFITDTSGKLIGVLVMRDLMLASPQQRLSEVMLTNPFFLRPEMPLMDAMRSVLNRHYPVYPVCDAEGKLVGLVRGQTLFEQQAIDISAQAGSMVGVEKEERLTTPWARSLKYRHPWLQLNLLTAFLAAGVVSMFSETIARVGVLAAFLPVLAGQSGNTGCQALAVALRGMTLGELKESHHRKLVVKEACLGMLNGLLVGITAGVGMWFFARAQHEPQPVKLAFVVFLAMTMSCVVSGVSGALVPMGLKKLGADPVTASSIFLTTATDVASMSALLGLASILVH